MIKRKGFTIVELLMVIGIIAVLMGIITTAASTSIKSSRARRADALCTLVQAGLATYYEQKGEWPVTISTTGQQEDGKGNSKDPDSIVLTGAQVRQCVKALIDEAKQNNPMMDISGLFVSRSQGELNGTGEKGSQAVRLGYGMNFMDAIRGTKQSRKKMKTSEMYFGYPAPNTARFRRFKMVYSIPTDSLSVDKQ